MALNEGRGDIVAANLTNCRTLVVPASLQSQRV
jgi:hypothetical protein